ncbi:MAG: DUF2779 domain-containing protein [Cyanobacteria bacterium P01_A01_bin.3]
MLELTKSRYLSWLQCPKRLWIECNEPAIQPKQSLAQQRIIQQGIDVGKLAWNDFPGGHTIGSRDLQQALVDTQTAIASGCPAIFEASFAWNHLYIKCDILLRTGSNAWELIEVKSATNAKPEYFDDLAIQTYVLQQVELNVDRISLQTINSKTCAFPDLSNYFNRCDVTDEVKELTNHLDAHSQAALSVMQQGSCPDTDIGDRCRKPNPCPFQSHCWQHVPQPSIFSIPRLNAKKKADLYKQGIVHLQDVPDTYPLSDNQREYVNLVNERAVRIDRDGIAALMAELAYPIHFLDFETINPAIPQFDGLKPYEQYPFQYSCHLLHADGAVEHVEFLHTDTSDPRQPLARSLASHLHSDGAVVAYSASFEKGVMQKLATTFPEFAAPLEAAISRLWDQLDVFRHHYQHPDFQGSNSIKRVFPVLCPERPSYDILTVRKGDDAQAYWLQAIALPESADKARMVQDLKDYCRLDTQAMLDIHYVLQELVTPV